MIVSRINVQVGKQPPTEPVLGQHTFHSMFDDTLGVLFEQQPGRSKALPAGISRVADVDFVGHFLAREANLLGINDDHVVSAVNVWREVGFVFAANQGCDLAGQPTKHFALSVNHNPFLLHRFFVGGDGFVTERVHYIKETN